MKKIFALLLAFSIMTSLLGVTASAEVERATRVVITTSKSTVAVNRTIFLDFNVSPSGFDYDYCSWYTDDYEIIDLDRDNGDVTGLEPGTAKVRVDLYKRDPDRYKEDGITLNRNYDKYIKVGTASKDIKVTGTSSSGNTVVPREVDDDGKVVKPSGNNGPITSATVSDAVKKALVKGRTTSTSFKNYDSVSAYALQSAASAMKGGTVTLNFDTVDGKTTEGRLTINPSNASNLKNDINLSVYTNTAQTFKVKDSFDKYFKNNVAVVKTAQSGSYGMSVKIAAKVSDSTILKSNKLRLYLYDVTTSKYTEIKGAGLRVDDNGFMHFTTSTGGYLVISNGALAKK